MSTTFVATCTKYPTKNPRIKITTTRACSKMPCTKRTAKVTHTSRSRRFPVAKVVPPYSSSEPTQTPSKLTSTPHSSVTNTANGTALSSTCPIAYPNVPSPAAIRYTTSPPPRTATLHLLTLTSPMPPATTLRLSSTSNALNKRFKDVKRRRDGRPRKQRSKPGLNWRRNGCMAKWERRD